MGRRTYKQVDRQTERINEKGEILEIRKQLEVERESEMKLKRRRLEYI